jgi:hypothetical protein
MPNLLDRISKIMATIKKLLQSSPKMRNVTPVPNGPLIKKKKGPTKGSTLKNGGKVNVEAGGEKHVVYKAAKKSNKPIRSVDIGRNLQLLKMFVDLGHVDITQHF